MARTDRAPSFQFYPRDYLADSAVQAMSFDEQGRYIRALCFSWDTPTPGEALEDQWRRWMCYSEARWKAHREIMRAAFREGPEGVWLQHRMQVERSQQIDRRERAQEGAKQTNLKRWGGVA